MNKEIEIYIQDDTFEYTLITRTRGYRFDVYVKYKNKFFRMYVSSRQTFEQLLKINYNNNGFYDSESNLLIVKKVTKENIIQAILKNAELNYFDKIKEWEVIENEIMYPLNEETIASHKKLNLPISIKIDKLIEIYSYKNEKSKVNADSIGGKYE